VAATARREPVVDRLLHAIVAVEPARELFQVLRLQLGRRRQRFLDRRQAALPAVKAAELAYQGVEQSPAGVVGATHERNIGRRIVEICRRRYASHADGTDDAGRSIVRRPDTRVPPLSRLGARPGGGQGISDDGAELKSRT